MSLVLRGREYLLPRFVGRQFHQRKKPRESDKGIFGIRMRCNSNETQNALEHHEKQDGSHAREENLFLERYPYFLPRPIRFFHLLA